jgi:RHS repeat-associated protein
MDYARNLSPIRSPIPGQLRCSSQSLKPYNRSHMQPALRSPIPDASLAVFPVNGENSHQGLAGRNPALYPVREVCNFTVLLGLQSTAVLNRVGPRSTGKERDSESGNDYFLARYYNSDTGRFLAPDWSAKYEPVPYAKLDDPQSLNLYAYVQNNPLTRADADGHAFGLDDLVGAVGGAVVGMATEAIKDVATGQKITAGGMAGAAVGGAIFGEGIVNMPETLGGSVVAAAALKGATQGFVSNALQQGVDNLTGDQKGFSLKSSAISTGLGAATGGLAPKMPELKVPGITSGQGNMRAVAKGVATKIEKGLASSMSLKTAVKGAVGGQVANAGKTAAQTYGTAVTTSVCNANGGGCK